VRMTADTRSGRHFSLVVAVLGLVSSLVSHADQNGFECPHFVEVFSTRDRSPVTGATMCSGQVGQRQFEVQAYELSSIRRLEAKLSRGLTGDPDQSKPAALQRVQQLEPEEWVQMQRAAVGLAKAAQYGLDRYPAIVFDGEAVVYGVTDLQAALQRYRQWREGGGQ